MNFFDVFLLSLIEGLTEFLPVSSTGHLILASHFMGYEHNTFVTQFNVIIQFGAILSVLVIYWQRFLPNYAFYKRILLAFLPAAIIGLLAKDHIDQVLERVDVVAWALVVGGFLLIFFDRFFHLREREKIDTLSTKHSLLIGLIQCLAFIPGVSRSAATILGGMFMGLSRKEAAEFSFFLALPTLAGACLIKSIKIVPTIEPEEWWTLLTGIVLSFVFAFIAIKFFIALVSRLGFFWFGVYRIILGTGILIFFVYR